jgi:transposase
MVAPSRLAKPSLAMVTFFQYIEKLSDRQAAEATMTRIDWKYALNLSMNYPGLTMSDLCDFRQRLFSRPDQRQDFQLLLDRLSEKGYAAQIQEDRLETMLILAEICTRTRLDRVMASM